MLLDLRLRIRNFWRKHKLKVVIALFIWLAIIIVNFILGMYESPATPSVSYTPHESLMDTKEEVPSSLINPIEDWMEAFFTACNKKEYENAYNLLSEEYRNENTLEQFKIYVDDVFDTEKIYILQNYSNKENIYIYQVKIMEDIMSTGLTGKEDLEYVEEKITVKRDGNNLSFSIGNKIETQELNKVFENEHMKVTVTQKKVYYDSEIYTLKIVNPTDYTIVFSDATISKSIILDLGTTQRYLTGEADIYVEPESTAVIDLKFNKFFDDGRTAKALKFDAVRVYESKEYDGEEERNNIYIGYTPSEEAIRRYSFSIDL